VRVIVVGAGVIGCAVAYELARRGAHVHLLDGRAPGRGATFASAGILAPAVEGHNPDLLHLTSCSLAAYDEFIRRVRHDSGVDIDYARTGTLQVAFTKEQAAVLAEIATRCAASGIAHELLDTTGTRALEPSVSSAVIAALHVPTQGYVSAEQLTSALVQAAVTRGATIVNVRVERIDETPDSVAAITSRERLDADAVVIATGSWMVPTGRALSEPSESGPALSERRESTGPPVKPIRGQLLHLRVDEAIASRVLWGPDCYIVPWRDRTVLVGATVEDVGFDESATVEGVRSLLTAATAVAPALDRARFLEVRVGLRPKTADELPAIGRSSTMHHVCYAMGLYRNGILLAPLTATMVADLMLDGREHADLARVRPDRFGL
jgi:glycine oxidase